MTDRTPRLTVRVLRVLADAMACLKARDGMKWNAKQAEDYERARAWLRHQCESAGWLRVFPSGKPE